MGFAKELNPSALILTEFGIVEYQGGEVSASHRPVSRGFAGRDDAGLPAPRPSEQGPPMGDYAARGFATS
jgi:hypothetical protein